MKKRTGCICFFLCALMLLTGCKIGGKEVIIETNKNITEYVFSVGETKCFEEEAKLYLCNYKNIYGNTYGVDLWETGISDESLEEYVRNITLDELTKIVCMDIVAQQQGMTLSESELALAGQAAEEYYNSLSDAEVNYMNVDQEKIGEIYQHYALAEKLYDSLTEDINDEISDDDARVIRIQQICVPDLETAQEVAGKLSAGHDFSAVASSYVNNSSADFTVCRGTLPEEVEAVAYELNDEEISDMIQTDGGFYFIKCLSKMEEELTEANKDTILIKRQQEKIDEVLDEVVGGSTLVLNEPVWDKIVVEKNIQIDTDSFFDIYEKYFK